MKALLLFGLLILCAALNLILNLTVPNSYKLILVPVFAVVLICVIVGRASRDRG